MTDTLNENWKPIPGFESSYEISDLGRARSIRRLVGREGAEYWQPEKLLKPQADTHGYFRVSCSVRSVVTFKYIHQAVLEAFVRPRNDGEECRHRNGDHTDNRLTNLTYGTKADNMQDALKHGTFPILERRPGAKLTRHQVIEIFTSAEPPSTLEAKYGIGTGVVRQIKMRQTWKSITAHLPDPVWSFKPKATQDVIDVALDRSRPRAEVCAELGISLWQLKHIRKNERNGVVSRQIASLNPT